MVRQARTRRARALSLRETPERAGRLSEVFGATRAARRARRPSDGDARMPRRPDLRRGLRQGFRGLRRREELQERQLRLLLQVSIAGEEDPVPYA